MQMKGLGGLNGWRWIFIIICLPSPHFKLAPLTASQEGVITCCLGAIGYVAIIDFPNKATQPGLLIKKGFLTIDEAAIVLARVNRDRGDAVVDRLTPSRILHHLKDWKIWEYAWLYFLNVSVLIDVDGVSLIVDRTL
jgi:hypothetical protein